MRHALLSKKSELAPSTKAKAASKSAPSGLRIGEPNDAFEREADRVADEVMTGGTPKPEWSLSKMSIGAPLQRKCACGGSGGSGGECEECKKKEMTLQRRAANQPEPATVPPIVHEVLRSPGQSLDSATRAFFEPCFGHDFSKVRVHADAEAAESARAVNAVAYTVGRDLVFGSGQYQPNTGSGKQLLAHELTHVIQQCGPWRSGHPLRVGRSTGPYEQEAESAASAALGGGVLSSLQHASQLVQRQADGSSSAAEPATGKDTAPSPTPALGTAPAAPQNRPVFLCSKSVALGQSHAFFRVGGSGPGNATFELEHDEFGDHCPCGIQGWPTRDYPEDKNSGDAKCIPAPAMTESCLTDNWNSYPIGKYCALGPNSNTYARFLAEKCGGKGFQPPGSVPGFPDAPPQAGTASKSLDARLTLLVCPTIDCNDQWCTAFPRKRPGEY
jgi:hypothetical protein